MKEKNTFKFTSILQTGLIAGIVLLYLSLVGMIESFASRQVIYEVLSLSLALILTSNFLFGYINSQKNSQGSWLKAIVGGLIVGVIPIAMVSVLVVLADSTDIRSVFVNASPGLVETLTFEQESMVVGLTILLAWGIVSSLAGALVFMLPDVTRRAIIIGLVTVLAVGTLEELISDVVTNIYKFFGNKKAAKDALSLIFAKKGLSVQGAVIVFALSAAISAAWRSRGAEVKEKVAALPKRSKQVLTIIIIVVGSILMLVLPSLLGSYLSEVLVTVLIFTLMGFGLNIVVGFAGLLDLGYVAFFAIGAYTMALLTSIQLPQTTELIGPQIGFWTALPFAVGMAVLWGILLGVPVLRMRGDYLAIVTLGFGEIIRVLALSNFLQPYIGGAQGILGIPKPIIFGFEMKTSQELYYLVIVACMLAAFISTRLRDSRIGRSWMAMREDEDVAEAMGINLIKTKLLAFATGAGLSGLAGAIFAAKLGSIYPHSFNLLISVNVLSLIIVGGIGSLPGVVVGALVLVGLPELLREFSEYRMLIFGALLVIMMLIRPEGLWPAAAQRRELHGDDDVEPVPSAETA